MVTRYLERFEGLSGQSSDGRPVLVGAPIGGFASDGSALTSIYYPPMDEGDFLLCAFYSREVTDGSVSISNEASESNPDGWHRILRERTAGGLLALWWKFATQAEADGTSAGLVVGPVVTPANHTTGSSGDSCVVQMVAFSNVRRVNPIAAIGVPTSNVSQQNIGPIAGITLPANCRLVVVGGKADDWTSVAALSQTGLTWSTVTAPKTTLGSDAGLALITAYADDLAEVAISDKTFAVTGGGSAVGKGVMLALAHEDGYAFPLASYEQSIGQGLVVPQARAVGADYAVRLQGTGPGIKDVGKGALRYKLVGDGADLDDARDELGAVLHQVGLGRLYTSDDRFAYASLAGMPSIELMAGKPRILPAVLDWSIWSDLLDDLVQVTETITASGQQWVVNNPGRLPVTAMVISLAPQTSPGGYTSPTIHNVTNGYYFEVGASDASADSVLSLDTTELRGPLLEVFNAGVWASAFDDYILPPTTQPVLSFRLEPGQNRLEYIGGASDNCKVIISFRPRYGLT